MNEVKLGALCWNQYTDWPSLLDAVRRADRLGYSSLWTWDHLHAIYGDSDQDYFEGPSVLAAWAASTEHVRLGPMVGANTFRNRRRMPSRRRPSTTSAAGGRSSASVDAG